MLSLNKLEHGLFPFGSASGMLVFHIDIKSDEEAPKDKDDVIACAEKLAKDLKAQIEAQNLQDEWVISQLGQRYVVFTGDDIMDDVNINIFDAFYAILSKLSVEVQKDKPGWHQMPQPYCFMGVPKHFTGSKQWYECFNLLFIECPLKDSSGAAVTADTLPVDIFSLKEMQNHSFSNVFAYTESAADVDTFADAYLSHKDIFSIQPERCVCVVKPSAADESIMNEVIAKGLRFSYHLPDVKDVLKV